MAIKIRRFNSKLAKAIRIKLLSQIIKNSLRRKHKTRKKAIARSKAVLTRKTTILNKSKLKRKTNRGLKVFTANTLALVQLRTRKRMNNLFPIKAHLLNLNKTTEGFRLILSKRSRSSKTLLSKLTLAKYSKSTRKKSSTSSNPLKVAIYFNQSLRSQFLLQKSN
jgi:hypothetical protein